ncbi:TPR repeat-containing protein [Chloroherpeton thalassium ATCC 35110]|uniref:TPR repeat-containing protein n=1 Tax=Chloroherpeton thalassium (strain ATCC 35110 / GB-78) TaxID=517418 RepID=B3QT61_CHLT3|nr:tetratricopeptide repeat protein [Chloroherpeton thalassium]ACF14160.1 TPR repeat-containing protein [Chloroherpeton thalassium ATCC 35110]
MIQYQFKHQLGELISELRADVRSQKPQLRVIRINSPVFRIKLIGKLSQLSETKGIVVLETCFSTHANLMHQLENEIIRSNKKIDAIVVNSFGEAVKDHTNEEHVASLLDTLGRETSKIPASVIICLPTFILDIAYRRSPNFWRAISENIIEFKPHGELPKELEYNVDELSFSPNLKKRIEILEAKLADLRETADALPTELMPALIELGKTYFEDHQYEKSFEAYNETLHYQTESSNPIGYAQVMYNLGMILHIWGCYDKARNYYRVSEKVREEVSDIEGLASAKHQLGLLYQDLGEFDKSISYYKSSISDNKQLENTKGIVNTLINFGGILEEIGLYKEAVEKYHEAFELARKIGAQRHMALSLAYTGRVYEEKRMHRGSVKYFIAAQTLCEKLNLNYKIVINESLLRIKEQLGADEFEKIVEESKRLTRRKRDESQ